MSIKTNNCLNCLNPVTQGAAFCCEECYLSYVLKPEDFCPVCSSILSPEQRLCSHECYKAVEPILMEAHWYEWMAHKAKVAYAPMAGQEWDDEIPF